jgi:hypothetical protein
MKKISATLIAGLFASVAFAQTPTTPSSSATPAAQASTDTKTPKAAFVDNKDLKASTQTDGKLVKKVSKADAKAAAKADKDAKAAAKADSKGAVKADVKAPVDVQAGNHGAHVSETAKTK